MRINHNEWCAGEVGNFVNKRFLQYVVNRVPAWKLPCDNVKTVDKLILQDTHNGLNTQRMFLTYSDYRNHEHTLELIPEVKDQIIHYIQNNILTADTASIQMLKQTPNDQLILSANAKLSAMSVDGLPNAISIQNDGLYAKDFTSVIDAIQKRLDKAEQDIKTNAANIEKNANAIKENTAKIDKNTADIATNAGNITKNADDIKTANGKIDNNTSDIATNRENIKQNGFNINQNSDKIKELDNAVLQTSYGNVPRNAINLIMHNGWQLTETPGYPAINISYTATKDTTSFYIQFNANTNAYIHNDDATKVIPQGDDGSGRIQSTSAICTVDLIPEKLPDDLKHANIYNVLNNPIAQMPVLFGNPMPNSYAAIPYFKSNASDEHNIQYTGITLGLRWIITGYSSFSGSSINSTNPPKTFAGFIFNTEIIVSNNL